MTKGKQKAKQATKRRLAAPRGKADRTRAQKSTKPESEPESLPDDQISFGTLSLHQLFEQQTRQMLDRADLDEEQKQNIIIAMSCPCCGAVGLSYTAKLKR